MKVCLECGDEVISKKPHTKYCTDLCSKKMQLKRRVVFYNANPNERSEKNRRERERRKRHYEENPELKILRNKIEQEPRILRLRSDPEARKRKNDYEKQRSRRGAGINSDKDLKCSPKGSGTITKHGYRQIIKKNHPNAWRNGALFEHIFVMSNYMKRPLYEKETVHHINGIRNDNRIENLELWSHSHPHGQRVEDKIRWCKEFLEQYGHRVIIELNNQTQTER